MKKEVYSSLKALESIRGSILEILKVNALQPENVNNIVSVYRDIRKVLIKELGDESEDFIPSINYVDIHGYGARDNAKGLGLELFQKVRIAISYIVSLDSSYENDIKERELEIERKEKELSDMKKFMGKAMEGLKHIPEAYRSGVVLDIKKKHRGIEKNTRKVKK